MDGAKCLIDSNILLRWVQPNNPDFSTVEAALSLLAKGGAVLCYTSQNLSEFWNACTRPVAHNGFGLAPEEASNRAHFFETRLSLLPDGVMVHEELRRLLVEYRVSGTQVHDARLVAAMHVHAVENIVTFNVKDFTRFSTVKALHPKDVLIRL